MKACHQFNRKQNHQLIPEASKERTLEKWKRRQREQRSETRAHSRNQSATAIKIEQCAAVTRFVLFVVSIEGGDAPLPGRPGRVAMVERGEREMIDERREKRKRIEREWREQREEKQREQRRRGKRDRGSTVKEKERGIKLLILTVLIIY